MAKIDFIYFSILFSFRNLFCSPVLLSFTTGSPKVLNHFFLVFVFTEFLRWKKTFSSPFFLTTTMTRCSYQSLYVSLKCNGKIWLFKPLEIFWTRQILMWLSLDKDDKNKKGIEKINEGIELLSLLMKVELNFLISISAVFFFLSFFEMPSRCLPFDQCLLTARLITWWRLVDARLDFGITMD